MNDNKTNGNKINIVTEADAGSVLITDKQGNFGMAVGCGDDGEFDITIAEADVNVPSDYKFLNASTMGECVIREYDCNPHSHALAYLKGSFLIYGKRNCLWIKAFGDRDKFCRM